MTASHRQENPAGSARGVMVREFWFPLLILALSLVVTFFVWRLIESAGAQRAEELFRQRTNDVVTRFAGRLNDHEQVLLGGAALFEVKGDAVTRADWRRYVSALRLSERYPGILGVGYAAWLTPAEKDANLRAIRAEGFPEYHIRPEGDRPRYTSILWLEPFTWRNQRAFGYDMYSEPVRREAMDRAIDSGETSVAANILLVQETEQDIQRGLLMYVPSYRQAMPVDTPDQRRAALRGFVYSPIRVNDFVVGTLGELPPDFDFEIRAGVASGPESLIFSSRAMKPAPLPANYRPALTVADGVEAYGVTWHFNFRPLPAFDLAGEQGQAPSVLFGGIVISILLSALAFFQARARQQAVTIALQMTDQVAARQKLALHVERTPLAVIEWDDHFRVTAWNRAAEQIFGYRADEAIGTHASFLVPVSDRLLVDQVLGGLLVNRGGLTSTNRNVTRDGRVIVCAWYNTTLVDPQGTVIGVASLAQDITERVQAEAQVRETLQRLTLATDAAQIGIWNWRFGDDRLIWDERLNTWYEVPAEFRHTGISYEFWRSRLHPEDVERIEASLRDAASADAPWHAEFRIVLPGGRIRYIRSESVLEHDAEGRPVGRIGVNRDITSDRMIEEVLRAAKLEAETARHAAEDANRAKSDFLATMSHEIRTPMTVFMGAVEQLDQIEENPGHRKLIDLALRSSRRLYGLINDVLDLSKIEAQRLTVEKAPFNLHTCLQENAAMMTAKAEGKGLRLELEIAAETPETIVGDAYRFGQVLINLLGNAIKFTEHGGIKISAGCRDGKMLEVEVSDTGIGIPADKLPHIFDAFNQVDSSSTRRYGGTGLGLAISRRLVELMGGTLEAESTPGQGSVFTIRLPLDITPA